MVARIPVPSDRSRGGRGASGQKEVGAAGGRRRGRLSRREYWNRSPGAGSVGRRRRMGSAERGPGARGARTRNAVRTEDSAGMGTAPRGGLGHEGDAGAGSRQRAVSASYLDSPHPTPPGHAPTFPSRLRRLGSAAARGLESPECPQPRAPCPRCPHLGLGGSAPRDAERGRIRRASPRDRGAGPPLEGRGDGRRGGCHASGALGNLGLKATPSGGGSGGGSGSPRALRPPARGGVCRRSPPPPSP